jgi:hypothetical protein
LASPTAQTQVIAATPESCEVLRDGERGGASEARWATGADGGT